MLKKSIVYSSITIALFILSWLLYDSFLQFNLGLFDENILFQSTQISGQFTRQIRFASIMSLCIPLLAFTLHITKLKGFSTTLILIISYFLGAFLMWGIGIFQLRTNVTSFDLASNINHVILIESLDLTSRMLFGGLICFALSALVIFYKRKSSLKS